LKSFVNSSKIPSTPIPVFLAVSNVNPSSAEIVKPPLILEEMAVALTIILLVNLVLNVVVLADLTKDPPQENVREIHQIQENHMEEDIEQDIIEMIHRMIDIQDRLIIPQIQEERIQEPQMKPSIHQDTEDQQHIKTVFLSFLDMRIRPKVIKLMMKEKEKKELMIMQEAHLQEEVVNQREIHHQDQHR
jgi:hypothetical protein